MNVPFTPTVKCSSDGTTCQLDMDIVRPAGGSNWPVFVLLQGGPTAVGQGDYLLQLATAIAHRGAVVMVADWRQAVYAGGGFPISFADASCAVGVARHIAAKYGGDGRRVTVVGHSLGGWAGAVISLASKPFTPAPSQCDKTSGSLRPDAFVDLDGATDEPATMEDGAAYVYAFFHGTPSAVPANYAAGDPMRILAAGRDNPHAIPILVVHAYEDPVVELAAGRTFHAALLKAGYPNRLLLIHGGHGAALLSNTVVRAIMALL
jgi:acetyl esterase/lipase